MTPLPAPHQCLTSTFHKKPGPGQAVRTYSSVTICRVLPLPAPAWVPERLIYFLEGDRTAPTS